MELWSLDELRLHVVELIIELFVSVEMFYGRVMHVKCSTKVKIDVEKVRGTMQRSD